MSTNVSNQMPYLRTTRTFPEDPQDLSVESDRAYVDIANAVNARTIGIFTTNTPSVTGESFYISKNQRQQALRKLFAFTSTASISHGITNVNPGLFFNCNGSYTDGTNTYGLIWGTSVAITGQILFYVTSTQIIFVVDPGAPSLTSGMIVLSWISQP